MTEDMVLFVMAGVLAAATIAAAVAVYWRRQKLVELAFKERERTLRRLHERFATVAEFQDFATSPDAQALFATIDAPAAIARRLLAMIAVAILLLALAGGLWLNALAVPAGADLNLLNEARFGRWWGTIAGMAGIGLFAAATVCARLGRRWNLLGS